MNKSSAKQLEKLLQALTHSQSESNTQILTLKDILVGSQQIQGQINADHELRLR